SAGVWFHTNQLTRDGVRTVGTVVDLVGSGSLAPVVAFETTDGQRQTYTSQTYSSPPAHQIGEKVTLWYAPGHPEQVVLSGFSRWFVPVLLGGFFLVFGGIGYGGLFYQYLKKRDEAWLQQNGQAVEATFTKVVWKTWMHVNGRSPYVVYCQWQDPATQQVHVFESGHIWYDPTAYVGNRPIQVLIDPGNLRKYYVDLSFLPAGG
ncbi:MAG: DUF3592 domain-containing protein, partial [Saprospiraceae bacterium]